MAFDIKCLNIANDFIDDHPQLRPMVSDLAQTVQRTIDEWIEDQKALRSIDQKVCAIAAG